MGRGATTFSASPWIAGGKLFCLSEDGETFVVTPGRGFALERTNSLDEMALATPAPVGDSLYLRTHTRLYRIGASSPAPTGNAPVGED